MTKTQFLFLRFLTWNSKNWSSFCRTRIFSPRETQHLAQHHADSPCPKIWVMPEVFLKPGTVSWSGEKGMGNGKASERREKVNYSVGKEQGLGNREDVSWSWGEWDSKEVLWEEWSKKGQHWCLRWPDSVRHKVSGGGPHQQQGNCHGKLAMTCTGSWEPMTIFLGILQATC